MRKRLSPDIAKKLGFEIKDRTDGERNPQYYLDKERQKLYEELSSETKPNDYNSEPFFLSAYCKETNTILGIEEFCKKYNQPFENVSSYKFLPYHYKEPSYNIVFKESFTNDAKDIDFDSIIKKYIKRIDIKPKKINTTYDFDTLTYTDVHIGMDTNKDNNSMYAEDWNKKEVLKTARKIIKKTKEYKKSNILIVDDLGDLLDGLNAKTTRGGHELPQNMTNEEAFDCALEFKHTILDGLVSEYEHITFNNICNDNHAGSFGYFVNKAFKDTAEIKYKNITVNNHRTFLSHYFVKDIAFVITHGKDDKTLKFGFKPSLDTTQIEKIDQYCKRNNIYANSKRIVFKKGDSHQAVLDMAGSDDFDYYNYPASSPSSQWVQNNFKKGRRGIFIENFKGKTNTITPIFF